jgi:hypothetical protein
MDRHARKSGATAQQSQMPATAGSIDFQIGHENWNRFRSVQQEECN